MGLGSSSAAPRARLLRPRPAGAPFTSARMPGPGVRRWIRAFAHPWDPSLRPSLAPSWTNAGAEGMSSRTMAKRDPSIDGCPSTDGLTRSQVARQLGVGITQIHRMRLRGELHAKRDAAGTWRYDPAEIIRVAAARGVTVQRTSGQVAAEAFRMFDGGGELKDIVMALQVPPEE